MDITALQNCGFVALLLYILRITADSIMSIAFPTATTLWALVVCKSIIHGHGMMEANERFIDRLSRQFNNFIYFWKLTFEGFLTQKENNLSTKYLYIFHASVLLSVLMIWDRSVLKSLLSHLWAHRDSLLFLQMHLSLLPGFTEFCCENYVSVFSFSP